MVERDAPVVDARNTKGVPSPVPSTGPWRGVVTSQGGYVGRMADSVLPGDRVLRHREAAARHEEAALRHEESASYWLAQGDEALAELEGRCAEVERAAAEVERDRADLLQCREPATA